MDILKNCFKKLFQIKETISVENDANAVRINFNESLSNNLFIEYFLDRHIMNNSDGLFNHGMGADFTLFLINEKGENIPLTENIRIVNCGINKKDDKELLSFGFSSVETVEKYRKKGVCTIVIADIIVTLIKNRPNKDFAFWLTNTSRIIIDENSSVQYKIYNTILDKVCQNDKRVQFKVFTVENREEDIRFLEKLIMKKQHNFDIKIKS